MSKQHSDIADLRRHRKVPARRGMPVTVDGKPGVILGARDGKLKVRFEGQKHTVYCHPRWKVKYFNLVGQCICDTEAEDAIQRPCKECDLFGTFCSVPDDQMTCDISPSRWRQKRTGETGPEKGSEKIAKE